MKRIAFLGPEGTVSEESTRYFFRGEPYEFIPFKLISDVFRATASGRTDYSVIPIENTIEGSVSLHLDILINKNSLPVRAEWIYPSVQHLLGHLPAAGELDLKAIQKVFSLNVAIAQCRDFLDENLN